MIPTRCSAGAKPRHVLAALLLPWLSLTGQTIPNPGFEADTFTTFPGYISGAGNGAITGWTGTPTDRVGLNPSDGSPFANNGIIPEGTNVAFIQAGASGPATLETTLSGLTVGTTYTVTFRTTARSHATENVPWLVVSTNGGGDPVALEVRRVEGTGLFTQPYRFAAVEFTATATGHQLTLTNTRTVGDHTVVVDDFKIAESTGDWSVSPWTGDEDSGINADFHYTHAYSFGSNPGVIVNDVPFIGREAGVEGRFALTGLGSVFGNRANNLTGASTTLAKDFRYGGAPAIKLENLKPNTEYVFSLYGIGFDLPDSATPYRTSTFSSDVPGSDRLTVDLNRFGFGNGLIVNYHYTTDELGSPVTISYPPTGSGTFHTSAFSNRELAPRTQPVAWSTEPWSDDESSGINSSYRYTHAFNLGSAETVTVNGIVFPGIAGANPAAENYSLASGMDFPAGDPGNNISGNSELLSRTFVHAGFPAVHNLTGLTPGTEYVFTIYSTGWEAPGGRVNAFIGGIGEEAVLLDQDEFDAHNGILFEYRYTANPSGTLKITTSSLNGTSPIHVAAISNREAAPVEGAPTITLQPRGASIGVGLNYTLSVGAAGEGALRYQWRFNGANLEGETGPALELSNVSFSQSGPYSVTVTNDIGSVTSEIATIVVLDNVPGLFNTGVANNGEPLPNGAVDPHYTLLQNANDPDSSVAFVHEANPGVWFANSSTSKWIAPLANTVGAAGTTPDVSDGNYVYRTHVDLTGFDLSTVRIKGSWATDNSGLGMRINGVDVPGISNTAGTTFGALKPFAINLENAPGLVSGINTLDFVINNAAVGYTALRVDGLQAIGMIPPNTPPRIVVQPEDADGPHNAVVKLSVGASGSAPLSYVWSRGETVLQGENEPTLEVPIADLNSGGDFRVVVSNTSGSVPSETATITVSNAIPIAVADEFATAVNTPLPIDIMFDLLPNDTDADQDEISFTSFSATSAQGGTIAESDGILTYTPRAGFVGTDSFTYVINDGIWGGVSAPGTVSIAVGEVVAGAPGPMTLTISGGTVNGTFTGTPGASFTLQRSTTLEAGSWVDIETVVAPQSGTVEVTDPSPPAGRAFYRIAYTP